MIFKKLSIYILFLLFIAAGASVFADQPSSSLDDKPSVDSAASTGVQVPAVPSDAAADTHTSYLYDLKKLIQKSRENIKEVNEKILEQAVIKRNQKREERAHEYYEKGVELTNEGKLDEARDYFEKAIRITEHPEMAGYIRESQRRLRKQEDALHAQEREHYKQIKQDENVRKEDVEAAYKEAVDLYKQKKYHPAKDAFEHVDEIAPDYRATGSYLKIIDQDIITTDALAAKQQAVEIEHQQKEAETARAKEKAMWLAQIEEKEKERKESVSRQAADVYDQAVDLYKKKKFAEAKKKFEEVSWVLPDYKATMKYLSRIDDDAQKERERLAEEQKKTLEQQRWEEVVEQKKQEVARQHEQEIKDRERKKQLEEQAQFLYTAALSLYDKKNLDGALEKFTEIEKLLPDFRSTRSYIARIDQAQGKPFVLPQAPVPAPAAPSVAAQTPVVMAANTMPAQVKMAVSLEDQQKQAQDIAAMADRSAQLYRQIAGIANDSSTVKIKREVAKVDDILNSLKSSQDRLLRHMRDEQLKHEQEESKAKQEERKAQAERTYQQAMGYLHTQDYEQAKIKFLELENILPDYKYTRRYLTRIDEHQKNANVQVVTGYEENQAEHLKQLQEKQNSQETLRAQQDQEEERNLEQQQQESLKQLAAKASDINDDIVRLSKTQDYEAMKAKFTELENTVTAVVTLKNAMIQQKSHRDNEKEMARESLRKRKEMISAEKRENRVMQAYGIKPLAEHRPVLSNQTNDADHYKRREIVKEQNMLFSEAVDRYEHKKYTQAKLLFGELADQNDRRAEPWLKKVDRAITRELLRSQEGEEKERTAFIADQVKAQRQLIIIQERERQRQKKLTEELEHQKLVYEDDRALQIRKEQTMKAQERERQHQEEKRLQLQKEAEKEQAMLRFHKVVTPAPVQQAVQPAPASAVPAAVTVSPQQIKVQTEYSNERKEFLDNKYKKEQEEKANQDRIKAKEDARQKRLEEKQKEIDRKKALKAQREAERQAKIKAAADAKAAEAKALAEKTAQEQKRREELARQQEQDREEKIRQDKIMREETQRKEELERQEREHQAQLEAQRESVRKQLEDGVEAMYQDAMNLFKQGKYTAAEGRFKDVQDIIPGYKRAEQYLDEAHQRSMTENSQAVVPSDISDSSANSSNTPVADAQASSSVSRQDSISKALDLFDPNAK
jgi:TolA-binding protein